MKYIYFSWVLVALMAIAGCSKDQGNYSYADPEVITVSGMEASYTVISELDRLTIAPEVSSTDPESRFEYNWGIYEAAYAGFVPTVDTLARTRDLDYLVKKPAKKWTLIYRVTNAHTGYSTYVTAEINIVTEFTRGWYVAKDDGENADMDLFLTPGSIQPAPITENIFSTANGAKMPGTAKFLSYFTNYRSLQEGNPTPVSTKSLIMSTSKDVSVMSINTLKTYRTLDNVMYDAPEVKRPAQLINTNQAYHMINNGELHSIFNLGYNDGRFGVRVLKDAANSDYFLSDYFLTYSNSDPYFFDELSKSFVSMTMGITSSGLMMNPLKDHPDTKMSAINTNKNLLYMGAKTFAASTLTGIAILQDRADLTRRILSIITIQNSTKQTNIVNDTLQTSDKLYHATAYTVLNGDENLLYFAVGNEIWSRNLSNNFEKLEYTIPAGEELTYIRHKKYSTEAAYAYNFIIIGTKAGARYKVRMFEKASGSIAGEPKIVLEGNGIMRDVMYVSPSILEATLNLTY